MRVCSRRLWLGILVLTLVVSGCGDPFGPPSRPKRASTTEEPEKTKVIYYIVPGPAEGDVLAWGMAAQTEANLHQVIFQIKEPGPDDPADPQPSIVRKAIEEGASALLVVPGDSPELPKALAEAESKKIPVVLIGRSIPPPPGSKPFTMVDHTPFEATAKRIVATTIEDIKKTTRPVEGTALVVVDQKTDATSAKRVEALKAAASTAGFTHVSTISIDGSKLEAAKDIVTDAIKLHPDVAVILADNTPAMLVASMARAELMGKPIFFVGGYVHYSNTPITMPFPRESCTVEGRYDELARLGVLTLLKKLKEEPVGEVVAQSPRFNRGDGLISSEGSPNSSAPMIRGEESQKKILDDIKPPSKEAKPQ